MPKSFICALYSLLFVLLVNPLYAQKTLANDSTYLALQKIKPDTARVKKMITYAYNLIISKKPLGAEMTNLAIKDAAQLPNKHFLGIAYLTIGYGYIIIGEYAQAYPHYMRALSVYEKLSEPKNLWRAYLDLTWVQIQLKEPQSAEKFIQNAIQIAKEENLILEQATSYNYLGILNDSQEKYDKAIESYQQALVLNEKKGTEFNQLSTLINLGVSQRRSKRYKDALATFLKAKVLADRINHVYYKQAIYQNLAELTFEMQDYENAETYILLAIENSKGNIELVLKRGLFTNLYNIYKNKGDYKKALMYADSLGLLQEKSFNKEKVAEILNLQTKYDTKLKDEKIAKQQVLALQQQQQLLLNKNLLALTIEQKENEELLFNKRKNELENQKRLQESTIQKDRLQAKLAKQTSEQQIFKQQEEIETKNRFQLFFGLIAIMAVAIALIVFYNQRKTKQLNALITLQKKDLEHVNEVKDRIFTIIGHDMRAPVNTLLSFNHLLEDHELSSAKIKVYAEKISQTLNHTAVLMENLLNWSRSQLQGYHPDLQPLLLANIASQVVDTLAIQAVKKGITLSHAIPTETKIFADANMTELIMRNLVANAIKFTPNNGLIQLNAVQQGNTTAFQVIDNGIGMSAELVEQFNSEDTMHQQSRPGTNKEKGTGLGLMLCKAFLNLMNGKITASSQVDKGSIITVTLPTFAQLS